MSNRKKEILKLYKQCLKSVYGIPSQEQRKIWLIDTRRKFKENKTLLDASRISNAIREGWDELQWMNKLHDLREGKQSTQPSKEITKAQAEKAVYLTKAYSCSYTSYRITKRRQSRVTLQS
mmetsp:Transcript_3553/g.4996  ORF Transcript_3553/g.4996 Transcript_3553/m.4996 type:complete len:121 (+) Transcript_3553:45-407(+)